MIENSKVNEWYALYTNPRAEKKLKRLLQERKIECFLPLISKKKNGPIVGKSSKSRCILLIFL
ncbi:transcription termination/antitermination factor NusG domain protein [Leptospira borgpetersenii serovar Pomona str. 200901868]|uniref:Transcription termination/antitermination factor NusG domain protein n=1 Tax=Leptospira borgpetersenii serovar Pomona str. 200901868 TaxID=1192866 RepID=M6W230_LEPBO|nr:transcription termination/antitermination factor NusG domain protein [Leptospira borgpetersenii serovar Pomona str. 200901868]